LRASLILLDASPVAEVAHRVGYSSASAYIAAFRRTFGRTPGQVSG
jgi:AraC-like DNA-binding protein